MSRRDVWLPTCYAGFFMGGVRERVLLRRAGALAKVLQETLRGGFHEIQHLFEAVGAAVVGIWNFGGSGVRGEFEEKPHTVAGVCRGAMVEDLQVLAVHRQNEVEVFEVSRLDDARSQERHVIAATASRLPGSKVRRLAYVVASSPRRIHFDHQLGCFPRRDSAEDGFRGRGAANISEADKQDLHGC
jgi:hypothetical protein